MAPSNDEIKKLFDNLANERQAEFFSHVADDVDWTVMGTHPLGGRYTTLKDFQDKTFGRLAKIMTDEGLKLLVRNVIGGGPDSEWAVVELLAKATCKNGMDFDMTYAWCCQFDDKSGKIVKVRAYLDSALVGQAVRENECPAHRADTSIEN